MESLRHFFSYLNDVSFPYVVLRNFDNLPYDVKLGEHSDLDLLVYDYEHFRELFPSAEPVFKYPRVRMKIPIADSYVYLDVRHVGDDYYPADFERNILSSREWNERGFYTPSPVMHTIALAYHAVHHKGDIAPEYRRYLGNASLNDLLLALRDSHVGWVPPQDKSVGAFFGYWKGATSVVERKDGAIHKRQVSYLEYPLLENEREVLTHIPTRMEKDHFPHVYDIREGVMLMEDCGEPLTEENLPENWKEQLESILSDLHHSCVQHRDIKLDNLMLKGGIIKLIDFGWAITEPARGGQFEGIESNPPTCLGFPNKSSEGFSDAYSMRRVIKQLECALEEREDALKKKGMESCAS